MTKKNRLQDAGDAITLQDMKGHIMAWKPRAEKMYGWNEAEALKMNISNPIPELKRRRAGSTEKAKPL